MSARLCCLILEDLRIHGAVEVADMGSNILLLLGTSVQDISLSSAQTEHVLWQFNATT